MLNKKTMIYCRQCLLGLCFFQTLTFTTSAPERFISTECFGSVLSLSCRPGHRIKVIDDFFGLRATSDGSECQYIPGDCTVTNNRYSSVIHRYCEGLESCTRFQVDRRSCGANLTNYEQVEYECVPDADVVNICSRVSTRTTEGYISTPNFPNEYSANSHCRCSLRTDKEGAAIQLAFTQFIIKYDNPCKDWVEVVLDGEVRRLCGAYRSTLTGQDIDIVFHSDAIQGHQGFWLNFKAYPTELNGNILLDCGPELYTTPAPTTVKTTSTISSTSTTHDYVNDIIQWNRIEKRIEDRLVSRLEKENRATSPSSTKVKDELRIYDVSSTTSDVIVITEHGADAIVGPPDIPPIAVPRPRLPEDRIFGNNDIKNLDDLRRQNSRTTGIIIISICVGGIVLLICILTVLLCINRRKHPKRQTLSEKKEKIQQRLSSLSFYDSIPLYDSIGRKGGVARAPPVVGDRNGNAMTKDGAPCLPGSKCMVPWKSDAPYWTTLHAELLDSDHDSAVYAELDKHSREGGATPKVATPAPRQREVPVPVPTYSVNLDTSGRTVGEDVSTHV